MCAQRCEVKTICPDCHTAAELEERLTLSTEPSKQIQLPKSKQIAGRRLVTKSNQAVFDFHVPLSFLMDYLQESLLLRVTLRVRSLLENVRKPTGAISVRPEVREETGRTLCSPDQTTFSGGVTSRGYLCFSIVCCSPSRSICLAIRAE